MRFTKGKHAFIVATHIDKAHIHNHIIFNSTNLECNRKFRDFWFSAIALQRLSDMICLEHGLSVIPKAKPSERQKRTKFPMRMGIRDVIREDISNILKEKPKDFEDFLKLLEEEGYEVKKGKHLAICGKKQKRFIRFRSLGEDFSEESIRRVIVEEKVSPEGREKFTTRKDEKKENRRIDLLIDIQEKMAQGKSGGYIHWVKKHNVKQLAESILFLQQNHIINYIKTKDTYIAYRKAEYSKKFFEEHREDILLHKAAKEAFSKLSERKIPKVKDLNEEFAKLLSVKKKAYGEYKKAKQEMRDYQIAKNNVDSFYKEIQNFSAENELQRNRQKQR